MARFVEDRLRQGRVQAEPRLAGRVASAILDLDEVLSCDALVAPYDAIAVVEGPNLDERLQ